jgi:cytochrome c-type biogenesis protein CcmH/NrfG
MAVTARRAVAFAWSFALLGIFLGTFRQTADRERNAAAASCDPDRLPQDIPGLERCVALDPGDAGLLTGLGDAYQSAGRADRAEETYRRALGLDPRNGDLHVRLGRLLLARGDRSGARTEGAAALRWQPGRAAARALAVQPAGGERP